MPIFITNDTYTSGYKININSKNLILTDDIRLTRSNNINEELFILNTPDSLLNKKKIIKNICLLFSF